MDPSNTSNVFSNDPMDGDRVPVIWFSLKLKICKSFRRYKVDGRDPLNTLSPTSKMVNGESLCSGGIDPVNMFPRNISYLKLFRSPVSNRTGRFPENMLSERLITIKFVSFEARSGRGPVIDVPENWSVCRSCRLPRFAGMLPATLLSCTMLNEVRDVISNSSRGRVPVKLLFSTENC